MEIGSLRVSLGMDSAQFNAGVAQASQGSRRLQGEIGAIDRASRSGSGGLQNLGFQVQDLAVQIAAGTSVSQALAQQLPQLLSGFGLLGIAIGTASAVAIPLASHFLGIGSAVEDADDAMAGFRDSASALKGSIDTVGTSLSDLAEKYGEVAAAQIRMNAAQAIPQEAARTADDAIAAIEAQRDAFQNLLDIQEDVIAAQGLLDTAEASGAVGLSLDAAQGEVQALVRTLLDAEKSLGITVSQAEDLADAFDEVKNSEALPTMNAEAQEAITLIDRMYEGVRKLPDPVQAMRDGLSEVIGTTAEAAKGMDDVGSEIDAAAWATGDLDAELRRIDATAFEFANQWDEIKGKIGDAKTPLQDLLGMLDTGLGKLQGWGSAIGDFVAGFAPNGEMATMLAGMTDGVAASAVLIREKESYRSTPYWDVNAYRAGYGSDTVTLDDGSIRAITQGMTVSRTDAERDLQRRITTEFMPAAMAEVGADAFAALSATQQAVLTSLTYNYGNLPDTVAAAVREGSEAGTVAAIRALGSDNGGINENRRNDEAALYGAVTFAGAAIPGASGAGAAGLEATAAAAAAAEVAREQAEATREATAAEREAQQERERLAKEAEAIAERELGYREDLLAAAQRSTQDAEFELSLVGKSVEEQARLRASYILTNQAIDNGIDLNEMIAGSTQTYGQMIEETAAATGRAVGQEDALTEARDAAAQSAKDAAAEMAGFVSSVTSMALGPITSSPIGGFLGSLPGFNAGAESVIGGFMDSGFTGATTALSEALGGATTGLAGLGTALGAIAGPVGLAIGLFNGIRGTTETLDEGLRVMLSGLDDAVVQTYETTKRVRFWGLMSSTSTGYDDADASVSDPIGKAYAELGAGILDLSRTLGKGRKDFADFSMSFQLSLEGMTDEEKVRAVEAEFGRVSDRLARMAGVTQGMIEPSETATQALERLVATFDVANAGLDQLDMAQLKTGEESVKLAAKMAEAAGGMAELAASFDFYATNFLSVSEQASEAQETFTEGLAAANINAPITTMEEFTAQVERLESVGNEVKLASLVSLADEFIAWQDLLTEAQAEATAEAEEAAQAAQAVADQRYDLETQILELQGNVTALRERELAQLDPTLHALQEMVWGLEDAQAAMEALDPEAFATEFLYLQAKAQAANQPYAPGSNVASFPTSETAAAQAQMQADATLVELKALRAVVETMSAALQTNTRNTVTELRVVSELVDVDGLLTRTA